MAKSTTAQPNWTKPADFFRTLAELTKIDALPVLEENQVVWAEVRARRGYGNKIWRRYIHRTIDGVSWLGQIARGEWHRKVKYNSEVIRHIKMDSRKIWKPSKPRKPKVIEPVADAAKSNGSEWRKAALEALAKSVAQI